MPQSASRKRRCTSNLLSTPPRTVWCSRAISCPAANHGRVNRSTDIARSQGSARPGSGRCGRPAGVARGRERLLQEGFTEPAIARFLRRATSQSSNGWGERAGPGAWAGAERPPVGAPERNENHGQTSALTLGFCDHCTAVTEHGREIDSFQACIRPISLSNSPDRAFSGRF